MPPPVSRDRFDALLLDLDGTLLDGKGELSARTRDAVLRAADAGYVVVLATGRSPSGTRGVHAALNLSTDVCCYNGSWIGPPAGGTPFHYAPIPDAMVSHVVTVEESARFGFRHRGDHKYTRSILDDQHRRIASWYTNVVEVPGERHALPVQDLMRVSLFFEGRVEVDAAWGAMSDDARATLHREVFPMAIFPAFEDVGLFLCEVQRKGRGKAEVYRYLLERHGIPAHRVVAVGDQANDVSLLEGAGLAVAMGNGIEALRAVADIVIGDHREDGLALFLDDLLGHGR